MTKEQAIEWLKSLNYCDGEETQEVAQAIDMAIKALEQQPSNEDVQRVVDYLLRPISKPPTTSKDCVSLGVYKQVVWERDIAIEQLKELGYSFGEKIRTSDDCVSRADLYKWADDFFECNFTIREELAKLPPVTPTRKVGEWYEQNDDYFNWYECSECGYGSEGEMQYSSEYDVRTKYCPNCGAEMRGNEK